MNRVLIYVFCFISLFANYGCVSTSKNNRGGERITVATVQREIRIGMTSADVVQVLGSPNVLTTDELRREVWVYDKVATDVTRSKSESGVFLLLFGGSSEKTSSSSTQRTLTIVVKFDENSLVRDFAYHSSKF